MKIRGFEVVTKHAEENVKLPVRSTKLSAGYDIFNNTGSDIIIEPGEISEAIPTKVKAYMLEDEYLIIHVRSSIGFKYSTRLANVCGIIDADYYNNPKNEGAIFIKLHNQGENTLRIPAFEAFAQGVFTKYLLADGDSFENGAEREGGLGSTTGKV